MSATVKHTDSIFWKAQEFASPDERTAYLDQACGGDPQLRAQIDELLGAYPKVDRFLESPAVAFAATCDHSTTERVGSAIGRYKLLEQVGEGGMGVVYVAEQTEPVRRRVALKIIKPGMDTKQVIARFEAERQALAMMDHPNIARVLDAGTTEAGRPYFVMELVRGMPITDYCDKACLSPRQRLELFVDVCQAVQHAHQKGIIHRDLKPSNVMITLHDGTPIVKVIDFGVAKAVGQQLTERTIYTALTQLVGTPLYMSPEQAEMSGLDVDTRSDVYSLGVLLYELLTGQTPFDKDTLSKAGLDEMRRIICEDEPLRPSRRFSTIGAAAISTASQHRGLDERRLGKILCGELDWIVMKALEKDRSRRYESASALATDIQRYLSDEPVLACPPTAMYRFQKFARKHKPALATAAAIALCLILGTTVSAWQAVRATTAEAQANANEQKAVANEQKANANATAAQEKEQEAIKQRDEVKALNDQLRRTLYASNMNLAHNAWDAGGVGRVRVLLGQHRPKPGEADLRGFEWHYLDRLCHSEILSLKGHSDKVNSVAFSPDGKRLVSASKDKTVKVWDVQSGQQLRSFDGHTSPVESVAYSPDGKRLASGSDDAVVKVWDAESGQELLSFKTGAQSIAFSPDGKRLVSAHQWANRVRVSDAQTGKELLTFTGHTHGILSVTYSLDGTRVASTSMDDTMRVWDAQTGQELLSFKGGRGGVAFSSDGKRLASGSKVWDAQTGQELISLKNSRAGSVTFSPDGKRLATSDGWSLGIWDLQTGEEIRTIKGGGYSVVFNPDGQRLASIAGNTIKIWDAQKGQEYIELRDIAGEQVAFSRDFKRMASAAPDDIVRVWDAQTGQTTATLKRHSAPILCMTFSPDGKRLAIGGGGQRLPDGTRTGSGSDPELKVWDSQTGQELLSLSGITAKVTSVAFSPDGKRVASASGSYGSRTPFMVKLWDAETGQELRTFTGHAGGIRSLTFSPDGSRLAGGSAPGTDGVIVWDTRTGEALLSLKGHRQWISNVSFSPDGQRLASASADSTVKVWDAHTGQELISLQGHNGSARSVVFSPDGKRLASASSDQTVKFWDAQTGQELLSLRGRGNYTISMGGNLAFSPDGNRLASHGPGAAVMIYDATPLPEKP